MIEKVIGYLRREVRNNLGVSDAEVTIGSVHTLRDDNHLRGVYISLVNIEEDYTARSTPHFGRQDGTTRTEDPPISLNLYLLFSFDFEDYEVSLARLSSTIEFFQSKPIFTAGNASPTNAFPSTLERLTLEIHNLNLEQLNHMWGMFGGSYLPSVLYRIRLSQVPRDASTETPAVTSAEAETGPR